MGSVTRLMVRPDGQTADRVNLAELPGRWINWIDATEMTDAEFEALIYTLQGIIDHENT